MFLDVLFSFQRTSHHLVLATLLVYHVSLLLSNTFLNFFIFIFVYRSWRLLYINISVEQCQILFLKKVFYFSKSVYLSFIDDLNILSLLLFTVNIYLLFFYHIKS